MMIRRPCRRSGAVFGCRSGLLLDWRLRERPLLRTDDGDTTHSNSQLIQSKGFTHDACLGFLQFKRAIARSEGASPDHDDQLRLSQVLHRHSLLILLLLTSPKHCRPSARRCLTGRHRGTKASGGGKASGGKEGLRG